MSFPLFRTMFKTNGKLMVIMGLWSFIIVIAYVKLYPSIANMNMNKLLLSMPKALLKAFNLGAGITSVNGFLNTEFYSMIYLILLIVYSVLTANNLVVRLVDRGSMSYLISTPVSRFRIVFTQAVFLITGLFFICLCTTLGGLVGNAWLLKKSMLDTKAFLHINLLGFLMFAVVCAYSFFFSCLFNDERRAASVSAGLTILFLILDTIGKVSDKLSWLRNFSLFRTFDPAKIAAGSVHIASLSIGLGIAVILLFLISFAVFQRKDLPV